MNRVLVVFSDSLLSELDSARGLVSRSAWIRQAVEDKLMKEAVAPLVPQLSVEGEPLNEYELAAVRPSYVDGLDAAAEKAAGYRHEPKPKARRKMLADPPGTHRDKSIDAAERRMAIKSGLIPPDRCNRGACTGTIKPNGHCMVCAQKPLNK